MMFKAICKIWRFILKIFNMIVDGIATAVGIVLKALGVIFGQIWGMIGSTGGIGNLILLGLTGLTAWWLWGAYSDKKEADDQREHEKELAQMRYEHAGY